MELIALGIVSLLIWTSVNDARQKDKIDGVKLFYASRSIEWDAVTDMGSDLCTSL